jgi:hypothetical protein
MHSTLKLPQELPIWVESGGITTNKSCQRIDRNLCFSRVLVQTLVTSWKVNMFPYLYRVKVKLPKGPSQPKALAETAISTSLTLLRIS